MDSMAVIRFILVTLACLAATTSSCRPAAPRSVAVVDLAGAPAEIGRACGVRLRERIRLLEERYVGGLFRDEAGRQRALQAALPFLDQLRPHHRVELLAMAESVGLPVERVLLANCFLDLLPAIGCATVTLPADAAPDGVARFGRNLDFPGHAVA
ncbi:MAG: hypothetical protein DWI03_04430, partial [Planctomycetota bacterium]